MPRAKRACRRRQCSDKVKHECEASAVEHVRELVVKDGAAMSVYKCRWCGSWHVGHRK